MKIEEHYLTVPEDSRATSICVKRREKNGLKNFNYEKRKIVDGERIQEMRNLSAREYTQLIKNQDVNTVALHKVRTIFGYEDQHFMLETYKNLEGTPSILKIDTDHEEIKLPPFIPISKDVTKDFKYSSVNLAKKKI